MFNRRNWLKRSSVLALLGFALLRTSILPAYAETVDNSPVSDKWALVVGVSKFKNPSLNLRFAAKDAEDFRDYLINKGHFAADHVKLLTNEQATEKEIVSELGGKWLPHVAAPDDLVVIFLSSHGSPAYMDTAGVNYILAHDSDVEDLYSTALEMQDLVEVISKRIHAKRVILIIDACHSGALELGAKGLTRSNFDINELALGTGRVVISSSLPEQVSWELKGQSNSIFTRELIDTLSSEGNRSLLDSFKALKDSVQRTALKERGVLQTPVLKSTWSGVGPVLSVMPHAQLVAHRTAASSDSPPQTTQPEPIQISSNMTAEPAPIQTTSQTGSPTTEASQQATPLPEKKEVELAPPDRVAIVPFTGPLKTKIDLPPGTKVLWGKISSPADLVGLAPRLSERLFYSLRDKFNDRILGPRSTGIALSAMLNVDSGSKIDTRQWTPSQWKSLAQTLQAKYLITGTVDEADWSTSFLANKYTAIVSAKLISGETGQILANADGIRVHKAPTHGDVTGGRKYFEGTVMGEAARALSKQLSGPLKKDN